MKTKAVAHFQRRHRPAERVQGSGMMHSLGSQLLHWSHGGWWEPALVPSPRPPRGKSRGEHPAGLPGAPGLCGMDPAALHFCIPPPVLPAPAPTGSQWLSGSAPVPLGVPSTGQGTEHCRAMHFNLPGAGGGRGGVCIPYHGLGHAGLYSLPWARAQGSAPQEPPQPQLPEGL